MVKAMFEAHDNGEIKERKFDDCNMVIAFGITDNGEDTRLQTAMLDGIGLSKTDVSCVLAEGISNVIEKLGDSDREKAIQLVTFSTRVDEICKRRIHELLGVEEEN